METLVKIDFDLDQLVSKYLASDISDPHEMAENAINEIPEDDLRTVLVGVLHNLFRDEIRKVRRAAFMGKTPGPMGPRSAKWEEVAEVHRSGVLNIHRVRVAIGPHGGWKPLGNCTRDDIAKIVRNYTDLANSLQMKANSFHQILQMMRDREVSLVRDIPAAMVLEAFQH